MTIVRWGAFFTELLIWLIWDVVARPERAGRRRLCLWDGRLSSKGRVLKLELILGAHHRNRPR